MTDKETAAIQYFRERTAFDSGNIREFDELAIMAIAALSAELRLYVINRKASEEEYNNLNSPIYPSDDSASIQPIRPRGNWIECEEEVKLYCSECKEISDYPTNYCPSCGARMGV